MSRNNLNDNENDNEKDMKKSYIEPRTVIVSLTTGPMLQSASSGVTLHRDTETDAEDVQLSRRNPSVWDDDEEDNDY